MAQAKILSDKDFKLAKAIANTGKHCKRNTLALMLTCWAGLRCGEVAKLLISDCYDTRSNVKRHVTLAKEQTKGSKARTFPVSDKLAAALKAYYDDTGLINAKRSRPLLLSQKNGSISANSMCSIINKIYRDSGIDTTSHAGRRTLLTKMADAGIGIHIISSVAGHSSISVTGRYLETTPQKLLNSVNLI